jgi:hypothetical protein
MDWNTRYSARIINYMAYLSFFAGIKRGEECILQ